MVKRANSVFPITEYLKSCPKTTTFILTLMFSVGIEQWCSAIKMLCSCTKCNENNSESRNLQIFGINKGDSDSRAPPCSTPLDSSMLKFSVLKFILGSILPKFHLFSLKQSSFFSPYRELQVQPFFCCCFDNVYFQCAKI